VRRRNHPKFYGSGDVPYVKEAPNYLSLTHYSKQDRDNLFSNGYQVENEIDKGSPSA
jgi:hypothetical protein